MTERDIELFTQNFVIEIANAIEKCVKAAVEDEREACAKVCDEADNLMNSTFQGVANAIRARGNT